VLCNLLGSPERPGGSALQTLKFPSNQISIPKHQIWSYSWVNVVRLRLHLLRANSALRGVKVMPGSVLLFVLVGIRVSALVKKDGMCLHVSLTVFSEDVCVGEVIQGREGGSKTEMLCSGAKWEWLRYRRYRPPCPIHCLCLRRTRHCRPHPRDRRCQSR